MSLAFLPVYLMVFDWHMYLKGDVTWPRGALQGKGSSIPGATPGLPGLDTLLVALAQQQAVPSQEMKIVGFLN